MPGEAIEAQRKSVELAPNDHLAWSNLGDALWIGGLKEEARAAFETAEGWLPPHSRSTPTIRAT